MWDPRSLNSDAMSLWFVVFQDLNHSFYFHLKNMINNMRLFYAASEGFKELRVPKHSKKSW